MYGGTQPSLNAQVYGRPEGEQKRDFPQFIQDTNCSLELQKHSFVSELPIKHLSIFLAFVHAISGLKWRFHNSGNTLGFLSFKLGPGFGQLGRRAQKKQRIPFHKFLFRTWIGQQVPIPFDGQDTHTGAAS